MADRGYWARLGLEGIEEERQEDHPLGFRNGTIENTVLPRLAVLLETLTTVAQREAFVALYTDLSRYCRQAHNVMEGLRAMARDLKDLEDDVEYQCRDLQERRELMRKYPDSYHRFDVEVYKRSSVINEDLERSSTRFRVDWAREAEVGRDLDRQLIETEARQEREAAVRQAAFAKEQQAKREAGLMERLGALYKTSPARLDETVPKNVRKDMRAAEQRLVAMGFEVQVEGHIRCLIRIWGDLVVYADPRSGSSLAFNVYKGSKHLTWFWIKDQTQNPIEKLEAKLKELQRQQHDE